VEDGVYDWMLNGGKGLENAVRPDTSDLFVACHLLLYCSLPTQTRLHETPNVTEEHTIAHLKRSQEFQSHLLQRSSESRQDESQQVVSLRSTLAFLLQPPPLHK